jgi:hypothetical protein
MTDMDDYAKPCRGMVWKRRTRYWGRFEGEIERLENAEPKGCAAAMAKVISEMEEWKEKLNKEWE